jgi:hypothetical protein
VKGLECGELKQRLRWMNGLGEGVYLSRGVRDLVESTIDSMVVVYVIKWKILRIDLDALFQSRY